MVPLFLLIVLLMEVLINMSKKLRFGAMWLPGFHRDLHNDLWWGDNFTEWDNVRAATPLYDGHIQPVVPEDGYGLIDNEDEVIRQFQQASEYGISVIGCYHYWFEGERLLEVPESIILEQDILPTELFLFWANHSWSKAWTNSSGDPDVLISQEYTISGAKSHAQYVSKMISKSFYYKSGEKPVFFIYDGVDLYRKCPSYLEVFRTFVKEETGCDLEIVVTVRSEVELKIIEKMPVFYDGLFLFEPSFTLSTLKDSNWLESIFQKLPISLQSIVTKVYRAANTSFKLYSYDAISTLDKLATPSACDAKIIRSVCCGFDNTPRYGKRARIFKEFSPSKFAYKLRQLASFASSNDSDFILINALNEWGEGMHLQPCKTYGHLKLKAVKEVHDEFN